MNYLAHLYLSDGTPEALLGSVLGDFRKGLVMENLSPAIVAAIHQHQEIDCFTDHHAVVRHAKRFIAIDRRRYAGILLDVFYDYYLSKHWSQYSSVPLRTFIDRFYLVLETHLELLTDGLRPTIGHRLAVAAPYMIRQDWLGSYGDLDGIALTLRRISTRLKRVNPLAQGIEDLINYDKEIERSFHEFFPLLVERFKHSNN
jgi:acyl carrier protein phosphodiesterase